MNSSWNKENRILLEDLQSVVSDTVIPWEKLNGSKVLVTGATGLIGSLVVKTLLYYADLHNADVTVGAFIRNRAKAAAVFGDLIDSHANLVFETGDMCGDLDLSGKYDYIIHTASNTSSRDFIEKPVETILTTVDSTRNLLEYSRINKVKSMLYISSMEVYGALDHELVNENESGIINPLALRSSYPQSKRLAENLCVSYAAEYDVDVKIVRPTLTFGPGVSATDNRVFAQFAKAAIAKRDIVLNTKGGTKRDYLYTADAMKGILSILLLGSKGEAYNLSNQDSYCTIYEMAELCCSLANNEISVKFDLDPEKSKCYPKEQRIQLDNSKINALNSFKKVSLKEQFERLIAYYNSVESK